LLERRPGGKGAVVVLLRKVPQNVPLKKVPPNPDQGYAIPLENVSPNIMPNVMPKLVLRFGCTFFKGTFGSTFSQKVVF
jgi:hypothetical protein